MDKSAERRRAYKVPRITLDDQQQLRRNKALEEQRRRRLQRVDSLRQLDVFSDLNIGPDADNDDDGDEPTVLREGITQFASLLPAAPSENSLSRATSPASSFISTDAESSKIYEGSEQATSRAKGRKRKGKRKPNKWANKCMYAELLEMNSDPIWSSTWTDDALSISDGLPDDLETAWVALAPLPIGKRCLAVTMQSAGVSGVVPNTILRSRLLGKILLPSFPSPLPPNTILDCILDENWKRNGLLHVLDVIRWKGQDVGGCDASFRFWWRDTRLLELPYWPPPPIPMNTQRREKSGPSSQNVDSPAPAEYIFPHPRTFSPVPYMVPTPIESLLTNSIPQARVGRTVRVSVPSYPSEVAFESGMQVDYTYQSSTPLATEIEVHLRSDGILLYVAEAMYESGTSPLVVWVPAAPVVANDSRDEQSQLQHMVDSVPANIVESPLDVFERLVRRRSVLKQANLSNVPTGSPMENELMEV